MKYIQIYEEKECEDCHGNGQFFIDKELCDCPECEGQGFGMLKDDIISLEKLKKELTQEHQPITCPYCNKIIIRSC